MKTMLIILILCVLAISGCTENGSDEAEKSVEELKALSLSAAENLTSYSVQSTMTRTRTLNAVGESDNAENATIITENAENLAIVNLSSYQAHAKGSTTVQADQPGMETNTTSTEVDFYQIGNSTYILDESGNWTHLLDPRTEEEIWGQGSNNQIAFMAQTFNTSNAEIIGSDTIDGTDAYMLRIVTGEADNEALYNTAFGIAAGLVSYPMFMPSVDRSELNETANIEKTIWISKESYLPLKYQSLTSFRMTPSIIGGLDFNTSQMTMYNESIPLGAVDVEVQTSDLYYDFNSPSTVTPPAEALRAAVIRPVQSQAEDVQVEYVQVGDAPEED